MRILLDQARLGWDEAWDLTVRTLAYTNHTLLPEALETWPVALFEIGLPRHLEIIYEVNRRFLDDVRGAPPRRRGPRAARQPDPGEPREAGQDGPPGRRRVAQHQRRGRDPLRTAADDRAQGPGRAVPRSFQQQDQRRDAEALAPAGQPRPRRPHHRAIGDDWVADLSQLEKILPLADDAPFRDAFRRAQRAAKARFADWLRAATGQVVDPDTIFDSQIKRIHEYKRQLLNVLHVLVLYNRLRENPGLDVPPRTVFFAGKAAPAYTLAKLIIHLINNVAAVIDADPAVRGRLKVLFLPEYNVSLAQRLIPASDISEQISTAGYEASGTSNMKFMMNGALTVGTRDGATIEMAEAAGEENFFLFGLTAEQVQDSRGWYDPRWHDEHEPETHRALDLIRSGAFDRGEPGVFGPIVDTLLTHGDHYMHLADLTSYVKTQEQAGALYRQPDAWARKAIVNVGHSGKFSSDRTIAEYARGIWTAEPCPVEQYLSLQGVVRDPSVRRPQLSRFQGFDHDCPTSKTFQRNARKSHRSDQTRCPGRRRSRFAAEICRSPELRRPGGPNGDPRPVGRSGWRRGVASATARSPAEQRG